MFMELIKGATAIKGLLDGNRSSGQANALSRFSRDRLGDVSHGAQQAGQRGDALWDQYQRHVPGLENAIVAASQDGLDLGEEQGARTADVRQAFGTQRGIVQRDQARYGGPLSGAGLEMGRRLARDEALAVVGARNTARRDVRDDRMTRTAAALSALRPNAQAALAFEGQSLSAGLDAARVGSNMAADAQAAAERAGEAAAPGLDMIAGKVDDWLRRPKAGTGGGL